MTKILGVGPDCSFVVCRCLIVSTIMALTISLGSCKKQETPAATEAAQKTFASPDDAGKALAEAAKEDNRDALLQFLVQARKTLSIPATPPKTSLD